MLRSRTLSIVATALLGCTTSDPADSDAPDVECPDASEHSLVAHLVDTPPSIDGLGEDEAWSGCRSTLSVGVIANIVYSPEGSPNEPSYPGLTRTEIHLQSVYTATDVYFLARWADPTLSLARFPWEKQDDGSWVQLSNKDSTGHENTYYEDKFAIQWSIDNTAFEVQGCYAGCHVVSDPSADDFPGKKYNLDEHGVTDMWHWKSVRTNPNDQLDDKYVATLLEPGNGRTADSKDAGGYKDNKNDDGAKAFDDATCPAAPYTEVVEDRTACFMGPAGVELVEDDTFWIFDDEKQPFVDTFSPGDRVAGMITTAFVGSRGDVEARGEYSDGEWTLEIKRALTTSAGSDEDVQFDDLDRQYHFGLAVFDNTQINHAAHAGTLHFSFER